MGALVYEQTLICTLESDMEYCNCVVFLNYVLTFNLFAKQIEEQN